MHKSYLDVSKGVGKTGCASEAHQHCVSVPCQQHLHCEPIEQEDPSSREHEQALRAAML